MSEPCDVIRVGSRERNLIEVSSDLVPTNTVQCIIIIIIFTNIGAYTKL